MKAMLDRLDPCDISNPRINESENNVDASKT